MLLIENEQIVSNDLEIASIMNDYFSKITNSLDIKTWPNPNPPMNYEGNVIYAIRK